MNMPDYDRDTLLATYKPAISSDDFRDSAKKIAALRRPEGPRHCITPLIAADLDRRTPP